MKPLFAYLFFIVCTLSFVGCASKDSKTIKKIALETNKVCPLELDYITTLNKVDFESPKTIIYHYTANINLFNSKIEDLAKSIKLNLNYSVLNGEEFEALREAGATLKFIYKTQVGKDLLDYTITPESYAADKVDSITTLTDEEVYKQLQLSAKVQNEILPRQLAETLELQKVAAIAPRTLEYTYRFNKNSRSEIDTTYLQTKRAKSEVIATINANKEADRLLKDNQVTFRFTYVDKDGKPISSIDVLPGEYL